MPVETLPRRQNDTETMEGADSVLRAQHSQIMDQIRGYIDETFKQKGVAGEAETRQLEVWLRTQEATAEGVKSLRDFYEGFLRKQLSSGRELHSTFYSSMQTAVENRWISSSSFRKWEARFRDKNVGYKARENWVLRDMPKYLEGWKRVAEERKELMQDPRFSELIAQYPEFQDVKNESRFLALHFDKRKGVLSAARGALKAIEKNQTALYNKANSMLQSAVTRRILGTGKDGRWLERMFKANAKASTIAAFVNGSGAKSLSGLIGNWERVKAQYDVIAQKFQERGADTAARGFKLLSESKFLSMHYAERVQYVTEAESRLSDAKEVVGEQPIFLKIRHAMDMKDWDDAALLIAEAKTMHLKDTDRPRLASMEQYVNRYKGHETSNEITHVIQAKQKLDQTLARFENSHPEMSPLVARLLKSNHANRNIHQFRWIWYNNIWCRTHGGPYLDDTVARKGASDDNEKLTKYRAEQGLDVGRHDVLDYETADRAYFRKEDKSKHKATFLHANVNSGGVNSALAEKLEHEQDPKWLYWTTLCPHSNGEPKGEGWMREGLLLLTEMRSLSRTINNAGYRYQGRHESLALAA